jgi:hypothetical protein
MMRIKLFIMKKFINYVIFSALLWVSIMPAFAHINPKLGTRPAGNSANNAASLRNDCLPGTKLIEQAINNVRATLLMSGDVWWNGDAGRYVVPKVDPASGLPEVSSIFSGAVWLGGFDEGGSLKVACQQYGSGNGRVDFWPGPLTEVGTTEAETCAQWDQHFRVTGVEILTHLSKIAELGTDYNPNDIPFGVKYYPALGNQYFADQYGFELPDAVQGLGAFFDANADGIYEPLDGDYPVIDVRGCPKDIPVYPDELIFWIYNDAGNEHEESGGDQIRMEVQVQAFGYVSNDELNNMTFQRYKLINRAVSAIDSTYFAMWVDPDLGCYTDDYIGCDVDRSLMFIYNADALDGQTGCSCPGGVETYCDEIPLLGVDYFRGPLAPKLFGPNGTLINPPPNVEGDTIVELGMSSFTYYNNGGETPSPPPGTDDPNTAVEYYNYLSGRWRDGTPFTFGGIGKGGVQPINYAFPDPPNVTGGWSMSQVSADARDRRTVQASGPFRLDPGAVNELIIGVPWVPNVAHPAPSIDKLTIADDLAQALFDNCFKTNKGPDAPDVEWVELDRKVVALLSNDEGPGAISNNQCELYEEPDLRIPRGVTDDSTYKFEGYLIYQLASASSAGESDLNDPDHFRLVAQVDIKNGVRDLYEWKKEQDPTDPENSVFIPAVRVEGANDAGIRHSFEVTQDLFSTNIDNRLINHKKYYYRVIAYGFNEYEPFVSSTGLGQPRPFIASQRNIGDGDNSYYTVIPRPIVDQTLHSDYGDQMQITRLDGVGVGGADVRITEETRLAIMDGSFDGTIVYEPNAGPITVSVYNPLEVIEGDFELKFMDSNPTNDKLDDEVHWVLNELDGPGGNIINTIESKSTIDVLNEQLLAAYGFSVSIVQSDEPGNRVGDNNGAIGVTKVYRDPVGAQWLSGVSDDFEGFPFLNYVKTAFGERDNALDVEQQLSTMDDGTWVPYTLCDWVTSISSPVLSPAWMSTTSNIIRNGNPLDSLPNIDVVFTSDKNLWSRCIVVETASFLYEESFHETEGNTDQFNLRAHASVNKDGVAEAGTGMGWFPGYAIDVETGRRVNIFFGENSTYSCSDPVIPNICENGILSPDEIGRDMIFNPTDELFINAQVSNFDPYPVFMGGQHFIYVTNEPYDECAGLKNLLEQGGTDKIRALRKVRWTSLAMMAEGASLLPIEQGLIPNDVTVHLRVDNPYQVSKGVGTNNSHPSYIFSTRGLAPADLVTDEEVNAALDAINVVPNPYYGFSEYETDQFSNTIKITNLPAKSTITIYSLEGKFIRQYNRDERGTPTEGENNPSIRSSQYLPDLEWDLKNKAGIPVASGVYLIHVDAEGLGQRTIKWFGVARQFDPSGL